MKLIDEYEKAVIEFAEKSQKAFVTHYLLPANEAKKNVIKAKQALIDYIEGLEKAISDIAPWLSASLSDDNVKHPCEEYIQACEQIFKLDNKPEEG